MINGREYRVTILLLYREIVADSVLGISKSNASVRVVLPEPSLPRSAMFLISLV